MLSFCILSHISCLNFFFIWVSHLSTTVFTFNFASFKQVQQFLVSKWNYHIHFCGLVTILDTVRFKLVERVVIFCNNWNCKKYALLFPNEVIIRMQNDVEYNWRNWKRWAESVSGFIYWLFEISKVSPRRKSCWWVENNHVTQHPLSRKILVLVCLFCDA